MHSKVLVVDLGEIARAGQDHGSAVQPVSKVRQLSGFVYGYTLSHSRLQRFRLALHTPELELRFQKLCWSTAKVLLKSNKSCWR